ncbi:glycosyltransferase family 4 protein [Thermomonospora catenispora]|uniref:glycosyltransferase family 4 protein n=1 Tax=Thermomonospora catenispora TaxID=2493090 RepID=UPI00111FC605|nr:glycosyltransferase family 4 protein [Thermomonospora catenispora]TNY35414.1 glycosyltransferase family 1 protein [Thermomonospora catenispora]
MKVALVLGSSTGGVGRHVRSVAAGLARRGARVVVCGPAETEEMFGFAAAGARFAAVAIADRPRPPSDARAVMRLRRLLAGADVVHAHGLRAGALAALACARIAPGGSRAGRGRVPVVVTLHNALITGGAIGMAYRTLERIVAGCADHVLGVSPDLEERMRELGARRVGRALVPAPAPAGPAPGLAEREAIRAELGVEDRPLLVTVGRLAAQKGLPTLLDAAAGWARRTPPPLVAVVGDGPLEGELRARIDAEGLPVRLLGRRSDVPEVLAAADVAVVPSVWEGQPLIVQEILRAGRPLVATRVGGIPALLGAGEDGDAEAGLLVPPGDAAALERAVARILDDPALAVRLGAAAAQRAVALPTEEEAVEELADLYGEVIGRSA